MYWYEAAICVLVGCMRCIASMYKQHQHKHGYSGTSHFEMNIAGAAGELAVAKELNVYWPGHVNVFRSQPDIPPNIEVRNRSTVTGELIVRDDDDDKAVFVLTVGKLPDIKVIGWTTGEDAKDPDWYHSPNGRPPAYFVPQSALKPMKELRCLITKHYENE